MRVEVDMDLCQSYGQCVFEAPTLFELTPDGTLEHAAEVEEAALAELEAAADACPVQAILLRQA